MHLRRALLLFAIVLVLAALAASISAPRSDDASEPPSGLTEEAAPAPARPSAGELRFSAEGKPVTRKLDAGAPARISVSVEEPGQVELEGLGRTASAVPGTPAVFELFANEPGRHAVVFESARTDERERVGTLVVERTSPDR